MFSHAQSERGIALPMAIFALVVIGGMVAGSFFIATQEQAVGRNSVLLQQAFSAAEEGAQLQLASWSGSGYNSLVVGDSATFGGTLSSGTGWYRGSIRRLSELMFLVRSEGFNRDSSSRQQVGLIARLRPLEIDVQGALATSGDTELKGNSLISGNDINPPDATGCTLQPGLPGVTTSGTIGGNCGIDCIEGDPQVSYDPTITDSTLLVFGDLTFDDLEEFADVSFSSDGSSVYQVEPSLDAGGRCNTGDALNWGEPDLGTAYTDACHNYFPIIYIRGNFATNNHRGQGILVVDGNLEIRGNFRFYGIVIVRGSLRAAQGTPAINGTIVSAGTPTLEPDVELAGTPTLHYSNCSVDRALLATASIDLLRERSWINLY